MISAANQRLSECLNRRNTEAMATAQSTQANDLGKFPRLTLLAIGATVGGFHRATV